jgi:hypothetical protein
MTPLSSRIVRLRKLGPFIGLPKGIFVALRRQARSIRVSPVLVESAALSSQALYEWFKERHGRTATCTPPQQLVQHPASCRSAHQQDVFGRQTDLRAHLDAECEGVANSALVGLEAGLWRRNFCER